MNGSRSRRRRRPLARSESSAKPDRTNERTHLFPAQLTTLVGRDHEIARLGALVAKHRLVTVTGSTGVGKTRVALEVAIRHFRRTSDEVRLVDLTVHDGHASLTAKVASVVGQSRMYGATTELGAGLGTRRMLLVLYNCDHKRTGTRRRRNSVGSRPLVFEEVARKLLLTALHD